MRSLFPLFALAMASAVPAVATEVVPVPSFRSVELRGGGIVDVVPGPAQRVTIVEGTSQFTRMRVEPDGKLRIDTCNERCPPLYRLRVQIQSPRAPDLAIRGGGQIVTAAGFRPQSQLSLAISGGGIIAVRPRTTLTAAVNGGGHIRYCGRPDVTMAVRGGGAVSPGC